jgi:thioester reductase-like protein
VADRIVALAVARGFPIAVYRPGRISGHSRTGVSNVDDMLSQVFKGCIELGSMPYFETTATLDMTPVDYVSKAMVYISGRPESYGKTFHLVNTNSMSWSKVLEWVDDNTSLLRRVPLLQWREEVIEFAKTQPDSVFAPMIPLFADQFAGRLEAAQATVVPRVDCQNTTDMLVGSNIVCAPVDAKLLEVYWRFLVDTGFLPEAKSNDLAATHGAG